MLRFEFSNSVTSTAPRALRAYSSLLFTSGRRLRGATLFPYTTLFRSREAGPHPRPARRPGQGGGRGPACRDRKSTRLNSSHVAISYAVFCLKKKSIRNHSTVALIRSTAVHRTPSR